MTSRTIGTRLRIDTTDKIIFIGILMGSLLVQCMSAPTVGSSKRSTRTIESHQSSFWWQQPCGQPKKDQEFPPKIRHKRFHELTFATIRKHKQTVLQSFRQFQSKYNTTIDEINKYYQDELSCQVLKKQYNFGWIPKAPTKLPKRQLERNQTKALQKFLKDTQIFAVIIFQLNKTKLKTEATIDQVPRFGIFGSIVNETRQVLCESEYLLNEIHPDVDDLVERISPDYLSEEMWGAGKDTSLTNMCTRDRAVLSAFSDFMRKWKKILKIAFRLKESCEET